MVIACDVDDVVAALSDEWYRRYNADYNDHLTHERVKTWDTDKYVVPECGKKIFDYLRQSDLYLGVRPIPGALLGVELFRQLGHKVLFVTRCTYDMVDQKARWLERHGFVRPSENHGLPDELVIVRDKACIMADLLIDDGGHNISAWVQTHRRAVVLSYPHNAAIDIPSMFAPWYERVHDWAGIIRVVEAM